ncbi:hypothetical protein E4T56_gene15469 [Termitomyces sp. T112]|nr:hypothetical protein E4T56_gene15469 [Termitomyces sp. T112]
MFLRALAVFVASALLVSAATTSIPKSQCAARDHKCCRQFGLADSKDVDYIIHYLDQTVDLGETAVARDCRSFPACSSRPYNLCCQGDHFTNGAVELDCVPISR